MEFRENDIVGAYRIVRILGRGGMGTVYEVEHRRLGVRSAMKTFTLDHGDVENFRRRFLSEGKVLARLDHPHIAHVFDLDILAEGNLAYFVMDLVRGKGGESRTLADLAPGEAGEGEIARWFAQIASALDYIHDLGIVHRDIKLNNLLLDGKGGVVLSDFGISKFENDRLRQTIDAERTLVTTNATPAGQLVMGTRGYLAPEILRGQGASAASDTFAFGMAVFRLLTGLWYEPDTNAFCLLAPLNPVWGEILPRLLDENPAKRPARLTPLAGKVAAAVGETAAPAPSRRPIKRGKTAILSVFFVLFAAIVAASLTFLPRTVGRTERNAHLPTAEIKGGETRTLTLDAATGLAIEFAACPAGGYTMYGRFCQPRGNRKAHRVRLTYPFLIMKGRLTYGMLGAIDPDLRRKCRAELDPTVAPFVTEDVPVESIRPGEFAALLAKLNERTLRNPDFSGFKDYEFRLPTEAERQYALAGNGEDANPQTISDVGIEERWLTLGFPKRRSVYDYPSLPESRMKANARTGRWGLHSLTDRAESVVDTIPPVLDPKTGRKTYVIGDGKDGFRDSFAYADEETDPVRLWEGKDAHHLLIKFADMKCLGWNASDPLARIPGIRLVYAPKLAALNRYPK